MSVTAETSHVAGGPSSAVADMPLAHQRPSAAFRAALFGNTPGGQQVISAQGASSSAMSTFCEDHDA